MLLVDGLTAGLMAAGSLITIYAALLTYWVIMHERQLRSLQKKIEQYETAATFAQAGDFKDAAYIIKE